MSGVLSYARQFGVFLNIHYWRTALLIARSSLARKYRNSFLGILWTLLQPVSTVIVYSIIMPMITHLPVKDYLLYIVCTLPLWQLIASSLILATESLIAQAETLKRCIISSTVFPVADVLKNIYTYSVAFGAMYAVVLLQGAGVSWHVLLLPLYLLPTLCIIMALSVGVAFVAPYIRDIGEALSVLFGTMFWFSAVVIPLSVLPENVQQIIAWNPIYVMMEPAITLIYHHRLPDAVMMGKLTGLLAVSVALGYALYRSCRRNFVYYL